MADLASIREIVVDMESKLNWIVYRCVMCRETHAARGLSSGCPTCYGPRAAQQEIGQG